MPVKRTKQICIHFFHISLSLLLLMLFHSLPGFTTLHIATWQIGGIFSRLYNLYSSAIEQSRHIIIKKIFVPNFQLCVDFSLKKNYGYEVLMNVMAGVKFTYLLSYLPLQGFGSGGILVDHAQIKVLIVETDSLYTGWNLDFTWTGHVQNKWVMTT